MFLIDRLKTHFPWSKSNHKKLAHERKQKGISTVIVTVFLVVVLVVGLGAMTWSLGLQNNFSQVIRQQSSVDIERSDESIEIRDVKIDNNKFNMTVFNTGSTPVKLVRMWVTNTTSATEWHQKYDLNDIINPGESLVNLGTVVPIVASNASSYKISVVTEKGSSANYQIISLKGGSPLMNLFASPRITPTGQDITLVLAVTNNLIDSNIVHSIKPVLNWTNVETVGGSITASATLISGPTPATENSLTFSETVYFKWIYNIVGDAGDKINFNATLSNANQGNYVIETVNVIMDTFAEQSNISLQTLELSSSLTSVRSGMCSISNGVTLVDCPISPALTDRDKTFMLFQATSNDNTPASSNVRCFIQSISNIKCDRNGTIGIVDIRWQVAEFAEGVKVDHLTPPCYGTNTIVDISEVSDMNKTFLLYSSHRDGTDQDQNQFRTVRLTATDQVMVGIPSTGSCGSVRQALQVVQFNGTSVKRGVTGAMTGTSITATLSPSIDTSRTMLLYSWRTAGSGADMCERMVRGEITSSTQITFTRATGCSGTTQIDAISWEVVEFTEGGLVRPITVNMNGNGAANVNIAAVDPTKSLIFAGGQWTNGQALGEGSYAGDDIIGAMTGKFTLTNSTNVQVVRNNTQGTAKWSAFVVQFGDYVVYNTQDLEFKIKNTGASRIWVDNNSRIVLNNTQTKQVYAGIIKSWKNETSSTTGNINNTQDSDAIEENATLKLVFAEPRIIPGNPGSGAGVKATPGIYSAYVRLSGYDEVGKFVLKIPIGTVEIPVT